jgi:hypothetical protein
MRTSPIIILILLNGCGDVGRLPANDLNAYALEADNGLRKTLQRRDLAIELCYRPKDLIIYQQLDSVAADTWATWETKLDQLDYFVIRLSKDGHEIEKFFASDQDSYHKALNYFSGGIEKDLSLTVGKERIPVESSIYMPAFGSSAATTILFAFRSNLLRKNGSFSVRLNDSMFGTGYSEFNFKVSDVKKIPRLQI